MYFTYGYIIWQKPYRPEVLILCGGRLDGSSWKDGTCKMKWLCVFMRLLVSVFVNSKNYLFYYDVLPFFIWPS